jgi:hypothetical protein
VARPIALALVITCALAPGARAGQAGAGDPVVAALDALGGADLVVFDDPQPDRPTRILFAALVNAPAERVRALLATPAAFQRAIPAFVEATVKEERPSGSELPPQRRIAWELEIPLWNLSGELWMRPRADGVDLDLVTGDLAPGRYRLSAAPHEGRTILRIEGQSNLRAANFVTRRLVSGSPLAEPSIAATAGWVLLRALALEAERARTPAALARRKPTAAMAAPPAFTLDGRTLGRVVAGGAPDPRRVSAAVRARPDGRLDRVEVAVPLTPAAAARVEAQLANPQRWRALPGWRRITVSASGDGPALRLWEVDSSLPFVDFDATWEVRPGPPFRAAAVRGDWVGAVMGWDLVPAVAVYSLHPRLDRSGYLPRKMIEAEPLLEGGLALGLAYIDAVAWLALK